MSRADKIESILSALRNDPQPEDITFTLTGYLLQEDGSMQETGDKYVIMWPSRHERLAKQRK